jgi:hypothetical protein
VIIATDVAFGASRLRFVEEKFEGDEKSLRAVVANPQKH